MIKLNRDPSPLTYTKFPDGTIQVWQLNDEQIRGIRMGANHVEWVFENDNEFMAVSQLKMLINKIAPDDNVTLYLPFLPYARQHKAISNKASFGLHAFADLLNRLSFGSVIVEDVHNYKVANSLIDELRNLPPTDYILKTLKDTRADIVMFPDAGAADRYLPMLPTPFTHVTGKKVRDPLTGSVSGYKIEKNKYLLGRDKTVLMVDDICDGGRTFIEAAKVLKTHRVNHIHLYTTHGLYSKGLKVLREAGIKRIFTRHGEVDDYNELLQPDNWPNIEDVLL